MELDELIIVWKKQNENINEQLQIDTLRYLLKEKSQGALSKIRKYLLRELIVIGIVLILCTTLFIMVPLPYTIIRWGCFITFDFILLWYLYCYLKGIFSLFKLKYSEDLKTNIERLNANLNWFRNTYKLLNLPIIFLCIVMFAGSQNLFVLIPWMAAEFLIWRSILLPKLMVRFEGYKSDLEYSLRNLQELKD